MKRRPLRVSFTILLATVVAGLAVRFTPIGLPRYIVKYGGSMLWTVMIYWVVTTVRPALRIGAAVLISASIATAVEFFKLYHSPGMDAFRLTLPGTLLLGRYFSVWDLVAYWMAIGLGAGLDVSLRRGAGSAAEEFGC